MLLFSSRAQLAVSNQRPITIKQPHACIEIANHTTLFSWPTWLVAWIVCMCSQRRQFTGT